MPSTTPTGTLATDWIARRAELSPDAVAIITAATGAQLSYAAWDVRVGRMARYLREALGVRRGDRLAILAENCQAYLDCVFACARIGALLENLNARLALPELAALVRAGRPRALLFGPTCADTAQALAARDVAQGFGQRAVRIGPVEAAYAETPWRPGPDHDEPRVTTDDPWLVCYTGGSTGLPKGAVLTHGAVLWNAVNTAATWGLRADDVAILDAPLYHTGGLNVLTTPLVHAGGASILCPRFDPEQVFDLLDWQGEAAPTLLFGVPTMLVRLVEHARWADVDLSRLRLVITGGAPAPRTLFKSLAARGATLRCGYGLSEAGPNNFWLPEALARRRPGAIGFPLLHVEARLDAGGELLLRGPHCMAGYLDDPGATAAAIDGAGWLHTGDLAQRDADGCYTIIGRRKEMYISGGENVYPAEVENALHDHPAVVEAAVVGLGHRVWGEAGLAAVALRAECVDEVALRAFLRERLAGFKVPRAFLFLPSLPRTGANKVDKAAIGRMAMAGPARDWLR